MSSGIYMLWYDQDHRYVGKTSKDLAKRMSEHKHDSTKYDTNLYRAIRKYGFENFNCRWIVTGIPERLLNTYEIFWIRFYDTHKNGLNSTAGGDGCGSGEHHPMYGKTGKDHPRYGIPHTEETKRKVSENNARYWLGKKLPKETVEKMSKKRPSMTGKNNPKCSPEAIQKSIEVHGHRFEYYQKYKDSKSRRQIARELEVPHSYFDVKMKTHWWKHLEETNKCETIV